MNIIMDVYWFGLAVYLQPIIWMYLYDKPVPIKPSWVQATGIGVIIWLLISGWSNGNYTNTLLIAYTTMVIYVIHHYRLRPVFQPICLAFLIVFVNSFYWEFPLHLSSLFGGGDINLVLLQALHFAPLPFLMGLGFKPPKRWLGVTLLLWMVVLCLFYARFVFGHWVIPASLMCCRFLSLAVLLWILRFPNQPENRIIYIIRQLLTRNEGVQ